MSFYIKKESEVAEQPVFKKILEVSQGGVLVKVDARLPGCIHTLYEGTPISTGSTTGEYHFMKSAVVSTVHTAAAAASRIKVEWPHPFKIGDIIAISDPSLTSWDTGSVATIYAIAATYLVTYDTSFTFPKHSIVYQAAADAATAPLHRPYGLLRHSVRVRDDDGTTCYNVFGSLVFQGSALSSNYKFGYPEDVKNRLSRVRFVDKGKV